MNIPILKDKGASPAASQKKRETPKLSSEQELVAALAAEDQTGLRAREVFRLKRRGGADYLFPDDPAMRCQLGRFETEFRSQKATDRQRAFAEQVVVFKLIAHGRDWAEAAANYRRLQA